MACESELEEVRRRGCKLTVPRVDWDVIDVLYLAQAGTLSRRCVHKLRRFAE